MYAADIINGIEKRLGLSRSEKSPGFLWGISNEEYGNPHRPTPTAIGSLD